MFDADYCATLTSGERRSSILALQELRQLLDELLVEPPTPIAGIVAAEGFDVTPEPQEKPTRTSRLSNVNRVSGEERAAQCKRALKSNRSTEPSDSSSRKCTQGRRGGVR